MKRCIAGCLVLAASGACSAQAAAPYEWHNAQIVGGGFVSGVQAHPLAKGLMYAKTDIGGAYRRDSADGPWIPTTDWIDQTHWTWTGTESLALDPQDPNYVFIAGGSYTNTWSGPGAMLRSADRGKTWQVTPMTCKMGGNENGRGCGERLAVDPHLGKILLFGSRKDGLWRSDDRSATWTQVKSFPARLDTQGQGIVLVHFDASSGTSGSATPTIIAGTADQSSPLYRSTDGGKTWSPVPHQPTGLMPRHLVQAEDGIYFISYGNVPGPNEITDGALYRWNPKIDEFKNVSPVKPVGDDRFCYAGIAFAAQHPRTLVVSTLDRWAKQDDLFRSVDEGEHWKALREKSIRDSSAAPWLLFDRGSVGMGHWMVDLTIDPFDSDHLLYVTGWGMWETLDLTQADHDQPTHWAVAAKGIEEVVANDVISPPSGAPLLSAMWDIDGFRHEDLTVSPSKGMFKPSYGGNFSLDFAELKPEVIVRVYGGQPVGGSAGGGNGGAISRDDGVTWTPFAASPAPKAVNGTVACSADARAIVWTPESLGAFVTQDGASHWQACAGLPAKLRVVADRRQPNSFYAFDGAAGTAYSSSDGGLHFLATTHTLPHGDAYLRSVPGKIGEVWLASNGGLFHSTDRCANFVRLDLKMNACLIGFGKSLRGDYPAIYLVGTLNDRYGFFRSDDVGRTWLRINDDDHQFGQIAAISGDPRIAGRVYIASRNRGVLYGDARQ